MLFRSCVYIEGTASTIRLYDEEHELKEVAEIRYNIKSNSCYIINFRTIPELQQKGLGRFIFNLALAHADELERISAYGFIAPTDPIAGVSDVKVNCYTEEYAALINIYTQLGNKVNGKEVLDNLIFESKWKQGERMDMLSPHLQTFIKQICYQAATASGNY